MQTELDVPLDRRRRLQELLLVLAVAFLPEIVVSFYSVSTGAQVTPAAVQGPFTAAMAAAVCRQGTTLWVLCFVLARQGRGLRQIGLAWRRRDLGYALALFLVAALVTRFWQYGLYYGVSLLAGRPPELQPHNMGFLQPPTQGAGFLLLLLYSLINPFYEELIVRAYLMSEVLALTNRVGLAVFLSVAVQVSYHFYQGFWPAVSYIPLFLTFALYYARTRRILPVILAHLCFDLLALTLC